MTDRCDGNCGYCDNDLPCAEMSSEENERRQSMHEPSSALTSDPPKCPKCGGKNTRYNLPRSEWNCFTCKAFWKAPDSAQYYPQQLASNANSRIPPAALTSDPTDAREAFLLSADVAGMIRDEYTARSQEEGLSPVQRERYTYAASVAKQVKGEILAHAGIQEWPAPRPTQRAVLSRSETPVDVPPREELWQAVIDLEMACVEKGDRLGKRDALMALIAAAVLQRAPQQEKK